MSDYIQVNTVISKLFYFEHIPGNAKRKSLSCLKCKFMCNKNFFILTLPAKVPFYLKQFLHKLKWTVYWILLFYKFIQIIFCL